MTISSIRRPHCAGGWSFAEQPDVPGDRARLFWSRHVDPGVLVVDILPDRHPRGLVFDAAGADRRLARLRFSRSGHSELMISEGGHRLRLCVRSGAIGDCPFRLRIQISGMAHLPAQLAAIAALGQITGRDDMPVLPQARAGRWIDILRAHDARSEGASHYDIAVALYGEEFARAAWTSGSSFLRSRVRRLIRDADALIAGGYRRLLR